MSPAPRIRRAAAGDATAIAAIYGPYVHQTTVSFEQTPPSVDEVRARITRAAPRFPWLVAEAAGRVIGFAYAGPHRSRPAYRWSVEVSVYVDTSRQRGGLGRALYETLLRLLEAQGFAQAYAGITQPNPPSVGLHEALGFELVGVYRNVGFKHGAWRDVSWYAYPLGEPSNPPAEPSDVTEAAVALGIEAP